MKLRGPLVVVFLLIASGVFVIAQLTGITARATDLSTSDSFILIGDTAYFAPEDYSPYRRFIDVINARRPAFTIHIGDIWGSQPCDDRAYDFIAEFFQHYDHPVVYTPGDNEWADCRSHDPLERLAHIRSVFFPEPVSLGSRKMQLTSQRSTQIKGLPENVRWSWSNVQFLTVHAIGSGNRSRRDNTAARKEAKQRSAANVRWITQGFQRAENNQRAGVVIALHAEMFRETSEQRKPFAPIVAAIKQGADRFDGPILILHGDWHQFVIDKPLAEFDANTGQQRFDNITRVQTFGSPDFGAVEISVDPSRENLFSFSQIRH